MKSWVQPRRSLESQAKVVKPFDLKTNIYNDKAGLLATLDVSHLQL